MLLFFSCGTSWGPCFRRMWRHHLSFSSLPFQGGSPLRVAFFFFFFSVRASFARSFLMELGDQPLPPDCRPPFFPLPSLPLFPALILNKILVRVLLLPLFLPWNVRWLAGFNPFPPETGGPPLVSRPLFIFSPFLCLFLWTPLWSLPSRPLIGFIVLWRVEPSCTVCSPLVEKLFPRALAACTGFHLQGRFRSWLCDLFVTNLPLPCS